MLVVGLALLSGLFFGAVNVGVRWGLMRVPDAAVGGTATAIVGLVVSILLGLVVGMGSVDPGEAWPFVLIGLVVPGMTQVLYVHAIQQAGASRSSIVLGTSPLLAAMIAIGFLDEPFHIALAIGTVLIVSGGVALAWEPDRPEHVKVAGLVLALSVAIGLAVRDNVVRRLVPGTDVEPPLRAVALILGATLFLILYVAVIRRGSALAALRSAALPFVPAGIAMGCTYVALLEALSLGRVTVVAPLNGLNALWTVLLSALLLRRIERVTIRIVLAAAATVIGGALVAAFR